MRLSGSRSDSTDRAKSSMRFVDCLAKWLLPASDRRRFPRSVLPGLVAYYWEGCLPLPHQIRDISATGLYLNSGGPWYPGTIVTLALTWAHPSDAHPNPGSDSISVDCQVIWHNKQGAGLRFVALDPQQQKSLMRFIAGAAAIASRRDQAFRDTGAIEPPIDAAARIPSRAESDTREVSGTGVEAHLLRP